MSIGDRLSWCIEARRRARRLGFGFLRRKGFALPARLAADGGSVSIECPAELGCRADFIDIFLGDCYRLETVKRLDGAISTVVDVGANHGWFSIAARGHFPGARIHAYEPNPAVMPALSRNARQVGVLVHPEAVGASRGTIAMICGAETNQGRTVEGGEISRAAFGTVLERLGGAVGLVKLDCEGAEWAILDHPEPWVAVRWLTMEYHLWARPGATHRDAARAVNALGFEILNQQPTGDCGLLLGRRLEDPGTRPRGRVEA